MKYKLHDNDVELVICSPMKAKELQISNEKRRKNALLRDMITLFNSQMSQQNPSNNSHSITIQSSNKYETTSEALDLKHLINEFTNELNNAGWDVLTIEHRGGLDDNNSGTYLFLIVVQPKKPATINQGPYR